MFEWPKVTSLQDKQLFSNGYICKEIKKCFRKIEYASAFFSCVQNVQVEDVDTTMICNFVKRSKNFLIKVVVNF